MNLERKAQYDRIMVQVRNSPVTTIEFEGNTYHFKLEYKLPYGECHYSRVFLKLIYLKECLGIIKPGDVLLETTSGSGGRAAAAVATALGYQIKIAVPAGGEKARERAIEKAGAKLILTSREEYVNGFPSFLKRFRAQNRGIKYIGHSMGDVFGSGETLNGAAINAFRPFVDEVVEAGIKPDVVICPLGNGTTTLPMATEFKLLFPEITIVGFEAVSSALAYRKKFPATPEEPVGKYQRIFGIADPAVIARHDLPGTTYANPIFAFPALEACIPHLDLVGLVTSDFVDNNFMNAVGFKPIDKSDWVVKWDDLHHEVLTEFGRTGRAGFAVAVKLARKKGMSGKHFLVPVFDAAWHYDS